MTEAVIHDDRSPVAGAGDRLPSSRAARWRRWWNKQGLWYLFLTPAAALLLTFMGYPLVQSLQLAFYKWGGLLPRKFIGLENFIELGRDPYFWAALWHTLVFSVLVPAGTVGIGLLLAVAISRQVFGWKLFRVGYYLPVLLSMTVVAALWVRIYEYNYGLLNSLLRLVGLDNLALPWIADVRYSLWSVIVVVIWQYAGFPMVVLLAAIENIPQDLHDAATIDGVTEWQRLKNVILPLVEPVLISVSILQIIASLKVFDVVYVLTKGGPSESSSVLGTYLYKQAFELSEFGYASAIAVVMFAIIFVLTYLSQRFAKYHEVEF
jgi:ABC-type sugar transport system permease subunit